LGSSSRCLHRPGRHSSSPLARSATRASTSPDWSSCSIRASRASITWSRSGGDMTQRTDVVLVYPQRAPRKGRHWIMPSLGLAYLAASLRQAGYTVRQIDHTFMERHEVLAEIDRLQPSVIGVYCMITMQDEAFSLASQV